MSESAANAPGDRTLEADVVIVGTGAGGAMAAAELAGRGAKVVALEEGPSVDLSEMTQREPEMMAKLYQERGGRYTSDQAILVLGGRCLGGSTVHNLNLCKRTPPEILDVWARKHRVTGCTTEDLAPVFAAVEAQLSVSEIPARDRNTNNRLLERGLRTLAWRGGPVRHNRVGCQGSGFCELGCPYNAKENATKVLLPLAEEHEAQVLSDAQVQRVLHDGHRARGVRATVLDPAGKPVGRLDVRARAVVLAGSAIGSAVVAGRSRLPDPYRQLGLGLRLHPGTAVAGLFEERVEGWKGIPQTYECTEWLEPHEGSDRRVWITTVFAHPVGSAVMLPGFGAKHREWMVRYPHLAVLTAMVHDESSGHVGVRPDGRPRITYEMTSRDRAQLALGVRACARILFAAGARRVLVPSSPPVELHSPADIKGVADDFVRPLGIPITSVHPLGTLRFGDDPRQAVVQSTGEHHQIEGLFALDGSLFPTSIGVPPQISIYAFAKHLSRFVAERAAK